MSTRIQMPPLQSPGVAIPNLPKVLKIFDNYACPSTIPAGVPFAQLTPAQQAAYRSAFRFSGFRPGIYQVITGVFPPLQSG